MGWELVLELDGRTMAETEYETWETTSGGGVWIYQVDDRGVEKPRRIHGRAGYRFRCTQRDREHSGARFYDPKSDPFRNGTFVRVNQPIEQTLEQIPEYDAVQALTDRDLLKVFASSGNAFQAKVRKLNERNVRRLAALAGNNLEIVSSAHQKFLTDYIMENYRPGGPPTDEVVG
jgi:hypothetical protein